MRLSDGIEKFLLDLVVRGEGEAEIQRNTLAGHFGCVPSQINYVIQTRFTAERGYVVESRRGGGGYIKITRTIVSDDNYKMHLINAIGDSIDFDTTKVFIGNMIDYAKLSKREAQIMLAALSDNALALPLPLRDALRAVLLKNMLLSIK
jgi:transcriptional regulator CtsR